MTIAAIIELINGAIKIGYNLYQMLQQIAGNEPIPTWEDLLKQNSTLQDKIDTELGA